MSNKFDTEGTTVNQLLEEVANGIECVEFLIQNSDSDTLDTLDVTDDQTVVHRVAKVYSIIGCESHVPLGVALHQLVAFRNAVELFTYDILNN